MESLKIYPAALILIYLNLPSYSAKRHIFDLTLSILLLITFILDSKYALILSLSYLSFSRFGAIDLNKYFKSLISSSFMKLNKILLASSISLSAFFALYMISSKRNFILLELYAYTGANFSNLNQLSTSFADNYPFLLLHSYNL